MSASLLPPATAYGNLKFNGERGAVRREGKWKLKINVPIGFVLAWKRWNLNEENEPHNLTDHDFSSLRTGQNISIIQLHQINGNKIKSIWFSLVPHRRYSKLNLEYRIRIRYSWIWLFIFDRNRNMHVWTMSTAFATRIRMPNKPITFRNRFFKWKDDHVIPFEWSQKKIWNRCAEFAFDSPATCWTR